MAFSISKWIFKICLLVVLASPKNFASADSSIASSFLRGSQESKSLEDLDIPEDPQEDAVTDDLAAREERELRPWYYDGFIAKPVYPGGYQTSSYYGVYGDPYYYPSNYLRPRYNYGPARYSYYTTARSIFGYGAGSYWPWGRDNRSGYWSF